MGAVTTARRVFCSCGSLLGGANALLRAHKLRNNRCAEGSCSKAKAQSWGGLAGSAEGALAKRFVKRSFQEPAHGPVRDRTQFIMAPNAPKTRNGSYDPDPCGLLQPVQW